jgi:hypothetical protein
MMKKLLTILSLFVLLTACTKEGPAGKDGKDGQDGNANVHSTEVTIYTNDWIQQNGLYGAGKPVSLITQNVVDNGTVLAYIKWESNGQISYFALPYQDLNYSFSVGLIGFINSSQPTSNLIFKVVVIDGTTPSSVDLTDYNAVMNYYNGSDK